MPLASEVAIELRKLADCLDRISPEVQIPHAFVYFSHNDKDSFLAKVTKAYMAIMGDGRGGVFSFNSLLPPAKWEPAAREAIKLGSFQVVVANPPFGAQMKIENKDILAQFQLGHKWKENKSTGEAEVTDTLRDDQVPQILFLERCLQLAKAGGTVGIVLPESAKEKPQEGEVIAVGPGKVDDSGKRIPMDVRVGDKILYGKYSGTEIKI